MFIHVCRHQWSMSLPQNILCRFFYRQKSHRWRSNYQDTNSYTNIVSSLLEFKFLCSFIYLLFIIACTSVVTEIRYNIICKYFYMFCFYFCSWAMILKYFSFMPMYMDEFKPVYERYLKKKFISILCIYDRNECLILEKKIRFEYL